MHYIGSEAPTTDLQTETLQAFETIMVAQSQECIYEKAKSDPVLGKKSDLVAKIAMQASSLFVDAIKTLAAVENATVLDPVLSQCKEKKEYYELKAQYHEAMSCYGKKKFGESIARFKSVEGRVKSFRNRYLPDEGVKDFVKSFNFGKSKAESDNSMIYHDIIPKLTALPEIGKASIAKPKPYNEPYP